MEAAGNVLSCQKTEMICKCLLAGNLSKSTNASDNSFAMKYLIFSNLHIYLNYRLFKHNSNAEPRQRWKFGKYTPNGGEENSKKIL